MQATKKASSSRLAGIIIGVVITVFWLTMMFSLVRDRILPQRRAEAIAEKSVDPSNLTDHWKDFKEFMIITFNRQQIGASYTGIKQVGGESGGYVADFRFGVALQLLGTNRQASIVGKAQLNPSFDLDRFYILANLGALNISVAGKAAENELMIESRQGTDIQRSRIALDRPISFLEAVRPLMTRKFQVKPGNSVAIPVVDPVWSMERGTLQATVGNLERIIVRGRPMDAYRVETRLNDFVSTSWVDKEGNTLKRQLIGDLYLEKSPENLARSASEVINRTVQIPELETKNFASVQLQTLDRISSRKSAPLEVLGSFFKLQ
jgi:hypothetical protein